jgi:isopenicillin-N epimerase
MFGTTLRDSFALDPTVTYLNNGGWGSRPKVVLEAQHRWQRRLEAQPSQFQVEERQGLLHDALDRIGAFVGAQGKDLAFVNNATTGVNIVLQSLGLGPGDEVVSTDHAYGAVRHTLEVLAQRQGFTVREVALPPPGPAPQTRDGSWLVQPVLQAITPNTRVVVLDHISSASALIMPLPALIEGCHARGVPVLVDGAHAPGQLPLDLQALGADWYTGNLHKWAYGPLSSAFVHAPPERQVVLRPLVVSWPAEDWRQALHWPGSTDPSAWLGTTAGLDFLEGLGASQVRNYCHGLERQGAAVLAERWGVRLPFAPEHHAAMVVVPLPEGLAGSEQAAQDLKARLLRVHRIEVPVMQYGDRLWVRISAQVYNELADYERLAAAVG